MPDRQVSEALQHRRQVEVGVELVEIAPGMGHSRAKIAVANRDYPAPNGSADFNEIGNGSRGQKKVDQSRHAQEPVASQARRERTRDQRNHHVGLTEALHERLAQAVEPDRRPRVAFGLHSEQTARQKVDLHAAADGQNARLLSKASSSAAQFDRQGQASERQHPTACHMEQRITPGRRMLERGPGSADHPAGA